MKHSAWNKLLLTLMSLFVIGIGATAVCTALHIVDGERIASLIYSVGERLPWAILSVILGLALIALATRVAYVFLLTDQGQSGNEGSVVIRQGENGSLQISAEALKTMVRQYCVRLHCVKSCECAKLPSQRDNSLQLCIAFAPEADIASELTDIQDGLREHLKSSCGLDVQSIGITIVPNNE